MTMTLLERIKKSKEELDKWSKDRRESALREARTSASYEIRVIESNK
jgi:hypothetical protein